MLLSESEWLDQVAETDQMYAQARLVGVAMADGERLWNEHRDWRAGLFAPESVKSTALSVEDHQALALSIQQRLVDAGVLKFRNGVN